MTNPTGQRGEGYPHLEAIEYVADGALATFGMRILLQSTWDAAQKIQRRDIKAAIDRLIAECSSTGQGKAHSVAYRRVIETLEAL